MLCQTQASVKNFRMIEQIESGLISSIRVRPSKGERGYLRKAGSYKGVVADIYCKARPVNSHREVRHMATECTGGEQFESRDCVI